ncbi:MAG: ATP-binding cassette domain-containing protein [Sphingomonas sp.]|uniref:ABC transporter ATP-binding protein n=1 Tax=Sphingomonas sp. TaxID=28214 RepID=UPI0025E8076E|nr:ATP-binding cassette domain-containing protein [Sphingomonas sp.]MBY0283486.1 ATP-binding cassette domain-containing protein [Sphingomonas sp.]
MGLAIETLGLVKRFGRTTVLDGVDLAVPEGCVYGFLGPNGAGKSTTMRALLGLIRADAGTIRLLGHDLRRDRRGALRNVGSLIEQPALYDHLSGTDNLRLTRILLGLPPGEEGRVLEVVGLAQAGRKLVGSYSLGMKQRLAIARAIMGTPRLLLLDEPTNGLDPDGIIAMRDLIRDLPNRIGGTVFVSSHLLVEIELTASVAGLMQGGRLVLQDKVSALLGSPSILRVTLDDPVRGAAVLAAAGLPGAVIERSSLVMSIARHDPALAAAINRVLVEAGLAVSALERERPNLEQVYRRATTQPLAAAA